jgi:hypothetical protein
MSERKDRDWAATGTVQGMADWIRSKSDAICVLVIRPDDAVFSVAPACSPTDAEDLVIDRVFELRRAVDAARKKGRYAGRVNLDPTRE